MVSLAVNLLTRDMAMDGTMWLGTIASISLREIMFTLEFQSFSARESATSCPHWCSVTYLTFRFFCEFIWYVTYIIYVIFISLCVIVRSTYYILINTWGKWVLYGAKSFIIDWSAEFSSTLRLNAKVKVLYHSISWKVHIFRRWLPESLQVPR